MKKVGKNSSSLVSLRQSKKKIPFIRRIAGFAAAAFIAFSPMFERPAKAEKPPATQPDQGISKTKPASQPSQELPSSKPAAEAKAADPLTKGKRLIITDGKRTFTTYVIMSKKREIPTRVLKQPTILTVRFYPLIKKKRFKLLPNIPVSINYSLAKGDKKFEIKTQDAKTRKSKFQESEPDEEKKKIHPKYTLGSPIELEIPIKEAGYTFSALSPNGLLEIVAIKPLIQKTSMKPRKPRLRKRIRPKPKKEKTHFPFFKFEGERTHLHAIGPGENSGDMNQILAAANIPIRNMFALNTGIFLSSFGLTHESEEAETDLRSLSANAVAGIAFSLDKHTAFARGFGGYRMMRRHIASKLHEGEDIELIHGYELGAQAGYSYQRRLSIS
jgi:hypothetical protein